MGLFDLVRDVVSLPVDVVREGVNIGKGFVIGGEEPEDPGEVLARRIKKILEDLEED